MVLHNQPKEIIVQTSDERSWFSVMPSFGERLTNLVLHDYDDSETAVLQQFEEEVEANTSYKHAFLIPFANKIYNGTFNFHGKQYHLKKNDSNQHHAAHGFMYSASMKIKEVGYSFIILEYNYIGDQAGYPFLFSTTIHYSIHPETGFSCAITVKNNCSTDMPLSVGWHPYFSVENNVNDAQLKLPECNCCITNEENIPVGLYQKNEEFLDWKQIGNKGMNNCYKTTTAASLIEIGLRYLEKSLVIWQEADKFPFFQIYTTPDRRSIAIEPMSGCIDSFNNEDGLLILKPNEQWQGMFGIK